MEWAWDEFAQWLEARIERSLILMIYDRGIGILGLGWLAFEICWEYVKSEIGIEFIWYAAELSDVSTNPFFFP
jgi:hypothetical protein